MKRLAPILGSVLLGLSAPAAAATVPGKTWSRVAPTKAGLDAKRLSKIATTARVGKSNCLVVTRNGKIADEWQFNNTSRASTQNVFSVTKSVTSTLVGIAQDDGDLNIDDSASKWIPEWRGTPAEAVTVRDLLANDSGRAWSVVIDYSQLLSAPDCHEGGPPR